MYRPTVFNDCALKNIADKDVDKDATPRSRGLLTVLNLHGWAGGGDGETCFLLKPDKQSPQSSAW